MPIPQEAQEKWESLNKNYTGFNSLNTLIETADQNKEKLFKYARDLEDIRRIIYAEGIEGDKDVLELTKKLNYRIELLQGAYKQTKGLFDRLKYRIPLILQNIQEEPQKASQNAQEKYEIKQKRIQTALDDIQKARKEKTTEVFYEVKNVDFSQLTIDQIGMLAFNSFRNEFTDPLFPFEETALRNKREAFEYAKALREAEKQDEGLFNNAVNLFKEAARIAGRVGGVLLTFAEEATASVGKSLALGLAWPFLVPFKIANAVCHYVLKDSFLALSATFAFLDKYFEGLGEKWRDPRKMEWSWNIFQDLLNVGKLALAAAVSVARIFTAPLKYAFKGLTYLAHGLEVIINTDNWIKKHPVAMGATLGLVGYLTLSALIIASVFTFGIPLLATACVLVGATIYGAVSSYRAAKAKAKEMNLELNEEDSANLNHIEAEKRTLKSIDELALAQVQKEKQVVKPESALGAKSEQLRDKLNESKSVERPGEAEQRVVKKEVSAPSEEPEDASRQTERKSIK